MIEELLSINGLTTTGTIHIRLANKENELLIVIVHIMTKIIKLKPTIGVYSVILMFYK